MPDQQFHRCLLVRGPAAHPSAQPSCQVFGGDLRRAHFRPSPSSRALILLVNAPTPFQRLMQLSRDGRGFAQSDAGFQRGRTRIPGMRAVSDPQPPGPELVCEPLAELVEQLRRRCMAVARAAITASASAG